MVSDKAGDGASQSEETLVDIEPLMPDGRSDQRRDPDASLEAELASFGLYNATQHDRGEFSVVYRCSQVSLERDVAVKVLTVDVERNRSRFLREQQVMGRLTGHPNIVLVLDVGETATGRPFVVMPYLAAGCLEKRIRRHGALPPREVIQVGTKIASALAHLHGLGVVHGDVKPANVLISDYGEPALTEFGSAQVSGVMASGSALLTDVPALASPADIPDGSTPDEASDVRGLGATLLFALTGHSANGRRDAAHLIANLQAAASSTPDFVSTDIDELVDVISMAMADDPSVRPSAQQIVDVLQQVAQGLPEPAEALRGSRTAQRHVNSGSAQRSPNGQLHRVPLTVAKCVGRELEVASLGDALGSSRLVTLTGVGGVGKTTVAVETARVMAQTFADGVWLVELGDLNKPRLLGEVVASAIGLHHHPGGQSIELLIAYLHDREALLVLDNCEHLIDAVADLVAALLVRCPGLRILATSRQVLDAAGESVLSLAPLPYPDVDADPTLSSRADFAAVELFEERARAAVPGFVLGGTNIEAVARICAQVDGLPLAIELAAARLRAMSVEQIAEGMSDRYAVLRRGLRGAPPRQKSLDSCVQWSYDLCESTEQKLWSELSVFPASFDLAAAQAVCGYDSTADCFLEQMCSLVDKSIVGRADSNGAVRFRLLETMRAYGLQRLSQNEHRTILSRHADYFRHVLVASEGDWFSDQQISRIAGIAHEMANIRAALDFYLIHDPPKALEMTAVARPMWTVSGLLSEGRRWLDTALEANPSNPTLPRLQALCASAHITLAVGDIAGALTRVAEGRAVLTPLPDESILADLDYVEGHAALLLDEPERARELCQRARTASRSAETRVMTMSVLGWLAQASSDFAEASNCLEEMLKITESLGESHLRARALASVGGYCLYRGETQRAESVVKDSIRHAAAINDRWTGEQCVQLLAWIAAMNGDFRRFVTLAAAAAAIRKATGAGFMLPPRARFDLLRRSQKLDSEHERRARRAMSEADFEAARAEGNSLTFDGAVAVALG
ncbi:protein kinase [Mycolicibacterium boenickei]